MGESFYRAEISDLTVIRFTCQECGNTSEFSAANPPPALQRGNCPNCNEPTAVSGVQVNRLSGLVESIAALAADCKPGSIQFPIHLDGE